MDRLRKNIKVIAAIMIIVFLLIIGYLMYDIITMQEMLINSPYNHRMDDIADQTVSGDIFDRNNLLLYSQDEDVNITSEVSVATSHLIGDKYGFCASGALTQYASILLDYDRSFFGSFFDILSKRSSVGNDISLTIDANLNKYAREAMTVYDGAVVLIDYTTGEILSMVSLPDFDPTAIDPRQEHGGASNDSLVNRCTIGQYSPGSIFYIATLGAAIDYLDDYETMTYVCTGSCKIDDIVVECDTAHGTMTIEDAFVYDCATVMARVGVDIGAAKMSRYARQLLFNKRFDYRNIYMASSTFDVPIWEEDDGVANAAIGQHDDIVTPLHIAMLVGALANDGYLMDPVLLGKINKRPVNMDKYGMRIFSKIAVEELSYLMGISSDRSSDSVEIVGKSGLATVHSEDILLPNGWFVGYIDDASHPLAVCVVTENSGDSDISAQVARDVMEYAVIMGY